MNSSSDRPMCEMTWMLAASVTQPEPERPDREAREQVREQQRLPDDLGGHRHHPRRDDARGDVGDEVVFHAGFLRCGVGGTSGRI